VQTLSICLICFVLSAMGMASEEIKTLFSPSEMERGSHVLASCRQAMTSGQLSDVRDLRMKIEKLSPRNGLSWEEELTYSLEARKSVEVYLGSGPVRWYGYDGRWPWVTGELRSGPTALRGSNIEEERRRFRNICVLLAETSLPAAWLNEEEIDGSMCDVVRVLHPEMKTLLVDLWIDRQTHLLLQMRIWGRDKGDGMRNETVFRYSDYREVAGLYLPHKWISKGRNITLLSLELDPELPDGFYEKPEDASYLPAFQHVEQ